MVFAKSVCTESLARALGFSEALSAKMGRSPVGCEMVADIATKTALILHPTHYSYYPDCAYTLVLNGESFLNVWQHVGGEAGPRVDVYVSSETEQLSDESLVSVLRDALGAFGDAQGSDITVSVKGRTVPPKPLRTPDQVVESLNKFVEIVPQGSEEFAAPLFVPVLVRPGELDDFLRHGRETNWDGLSPSAKVLFDPILKRLADEQKSA